MGEAIANSYYRLCFPTASLYSQMEAEFLANRAAMQVVIQQELTIAIEVARALYEAKQKTELGLILKDYFNRVDRICIPLKSLI
jgi:hypothetical protein